MSFEFLKKNKLRKSIIGIALLVVIVLSIVLNWDVHGIPDIRREWHTKEYLDAVAAGKNDVNNISDPDLKNLLIREPELPLTWIRKIYYPDVRNSYINQEGNEASYAFFILIDGDIAWHYQLCYDNKIIKSLIEQRFDAKEFDPKYETIFQEVDQKVNEIMKRKNIKGLGSCYYYWDLKKKYLKTEGIDWKSPAELNDTCYD
jgi:hypothetical protein